MAKYCNLDKILKLLKDEKIVNPKATWENVYFYRPKSTKDNPDGYKGRMGIYEILPITESIKDLIVRQATSDQIQAQAQKEGMKIMVEDGFIKAAQGLTSLEEILRVITE